MHIPNSTTIFRILIAQHPSERRDASVNGGRSRHRRNAIDSSQCASYHRPGDCMVLNRTRVIRAPARKRPTAKAKSSCCAKSPRHGSAAPLRKSPPTRLAIGPLTATVEERHGDGAAASCSIRQMCSTFSNRPARCLPPCPPFAPSIGPDVPDIYARTRLGRRAHRLHLQSICIARCRRGRTLTLHVGTAPSVPSAPNASKTTHSNRNPSTFAGNGDTLNAARAASSQSHRRRRNDLDPCRNAISRGRFHSGAAHRALHLPRPTHFRAPCG